MVKLGLLLLITVYRVFTTGDDCGCHGRCSDPILDWKADCPSYGFDCQRNHAGLGLFKRHAQRDYITLKCAESKATLFVNGKRQKKLKCKKSSGKWMKRDGCDSTDSALCALPCSACSTRVPSFLSMDAASISVLPASDNEGRPCSIGFCAGDGLTLIGIDSTNSSTIIDGNVTCVGSGWMDGNGRVYSYAVCSYYSCSAISIAAPSTDTWSVISAGTRSLSCPSGSFLMYHNDLFGYSWQTKYPLVCGPGNKWQLYGLRLDSKYFANVTCIPYEPCAMEIALPSDCDDDTCVPVIQTIVPLGTSNVTLLSCEDSENYVMHSVDDTFHGLIQPLICSGQQILNFANTDKFTNLGCLKAGTCPSDIGDIGDVICAEDRSLCTAVLKSTPTSFACPPGSTLIYKMPTYYYAAAGNLTCTPGGKTYIDTGALYASNVVEIRGMTCTTRSDLSCRRPPMMFVHDIISFEFPPDTQSPGPYSSLPLGNVDSEWRLLFRLEDGGLVYYNDDMTNVALQLQCGTDGLWRTPDGTVVTTASLFYTKCSETAPPTPPGTSVTDKADGFTWVCSSSIVYQLAGDDTVHDLHSAPGAAIICSPGGDFGLPGGNGYFVVPFDTKIGCSAS